MHTINHKTDIAFVARSAKLRLKLQWECHVEFWSIGLILSNMPKDLEHPLFQILLENVEVHCIYFQCAHVNC